MSEFERLAQYVYISMTTAGREHARSVAAGLERDLNITLTPGSLMVRADQIARERAF